VLCLPQKEINFFSDEEKWEQGLAWYEREYKKKCQSKSKLGEFSTEYFYSVEAAERIYQSYPEIKLLLSLRDPVDRAFSQYFNSIKSGAISKGTSFLDAIAKDNTYLQQGKYKAQLENYLEYFSLDSMHILVYEDISANPLECIQSMYKFLAVDDTFIPANVNERINTARVPKNQNVDTMINTVSKKLQASKLGDSVWWAVKNSGIPKYLRSINTEETKEHLSPQLYAELKKNYQEDIEYLEIKLNRKLPWKFEKEV